MWDAIHRLGSACLDSRPGWAKHLSVFEVASAVIALP